MWHCAPCIVVSYTVGISICMACSSIYIRRYTSTVTVLYLVYIALCVNCQRNMQYTSKHDPPIQNH